MRLSLLQVDSRNEDNTINGVWLQNSTGTLEEARVKSQATMQANGNRIQVAVVEAIPKNYNL
jgi:hypothetical protein